MEEILLFCQSSGDQFPDFLGKNDCNGNEGQKGPVGLLLLAVS